MLLDMRPADVRRGHWVHAHYRQGPSHALVPRGAGGEQGGPGSTEDGGWWGVVVWRRRERVAERVIMIMWY